MCYELSCLLQGHPNQPELLTCGCGSRVAAAEIALHGPGNYSKADLRVELCREPNQVLLDWGRKWWQTISVPEPTWRSVKVDDL